MMRNGMRLIASVLVLPVVAAAGAVWSGAAVASPAPAPAVVSDERVGERLIDVEIDSAALGGRARVRLLTPDGWDERRPGDRWPVLYLLHGMFGTYEDWTAKSDVEDRPELRDVLVVMPNGGYPGGYYGGYGALVYAAHRPGMFRAVAGYSGPVHLLHPASVKQWREAFQVADGGSVYRDLWGDPVAQRANWRRHDPYHLAGRLRHTPVFLSCGDGVPGPLDGPDTGEFDQTTEAFDRILNRSLAARMRHLGVPVTTHFYRGTHQAPYWERELYRSLPMLLTAIGSDGR